MDSSRREDYLVGELGQELEDDEVDEFDLENDTEVRKGVPKQRKRKGTKASDEPKKRRAPKWTAEQDRTLKEEYEKFRDMDSVFEILAEHEAFEVNS